MIYPATQVHVPVLAAIHAAAFFQREAWGADAFSMQLALPGVFGLLHETGGMLLARVAADEAEILTLAVMPEVRRRGIASALLRAAVAAAGQRGAKAVFLEVSSGNQGGQALYQGLGFVEAGRRRAYYSDGSDALVLSRPVAAAGG